MHPQRRVGFEDKHGGGMKPLILTMLRSYAVALPSYLTTIWLLAVLHALEQTGIEYKVNICPESIHGFIITHKHKHLDYI